MARQLAALDGSAGSATAQTVSGTISGTSRYTLIGAGWRFNTNDLDTVVYGTGNTIYDLGVDVAALVTTVNFQTSRQLDIFEAFDGDHPSNGSITVTINYTGSVRGVTMIAQYDSADQTDGHRGTPVTATHDSNTAWDLTSISNDGGDVETLGFISSEGGNGQDHTPDADNPELGETQNGTGASGADATMVADTTSRGTLGGDWSEAEGYAAWGASIIPAGAGAQTLTPTAISSAESFGTAQLNIQVSGITGIASAESFGTAVLVLYALPTGIASAESFGTPQLNLKLEITAIATAEAFGTATMQPGAVSVSPGGIASAESFGTAQLNFALTGSGITSAESFGTAQLNLFITGTGIASAESFGTTVVLGPQTVTVDTGIASAESFGTATFVLYVIGSGIGSAESLGTPQLNLVLIGAGITSGESFGTAQLNQQIVGTGIASAESFGTATVTVAAGEQFISSAGAIASAESFGTTVLVAGAVTVSPSGIASAESFGSAQVNLVLIGAGIASAEAFGTAQLNLRIILTGIASAEAFGTADVSVATGDQTLSPSGILSVESFGTSMLEVEAVRAYGGTPSDDLSAFQKIDIFQAPLISNAETRAIPSPEEAIQRSRAEVKAAQQKITLQEFVNNAKYMASQVVQQDRKAARAAEKAARAELDKRLARKETSLVNLELAKLARAEEQARQDAIREQRLKNLKKARRAKKRKKKK